MSTRRTIILSKPSSHGAVGPSSVTMSPNSSASSTTSSSGDLDEFLVRRGKKRRLDHLTWEEKVQRKKLKNRVAAQTSRDRKKQKMDEMEDNLSQVTEENEQLRADYRSMESDNAKLRLQNDDLQQQVERLRRQLSEQEQQLADRDQQLALLLKTRDLQVKIEEEEERAEGEALPDSVETKASVADIALKTGSAASTDVDPLQQGLSAAQTKTSSSVWQVIALCLLYKICSRPATAEKGTATSSPPAPCLTCAPGKSLPKLYSQISPDKWQAMLRAAANQLPRMQAPYHHCLDSWWGPDQKAWNPPAKVEA